MEALKIEKYPSPQKIIFEQKMVHFIKRTFEQKLSDYLSLTPVSAPLFVEKGTGIQDDLNGFERPISFKGRSSDKEQTFEIVHSLAKWKRLALAQYAIPAGEGILTNMQALRPDEESLGPFHSLFVDQWDWEKVITAKERNLTTLKDHVKKIYNALRKTHLEFCHKFKQNPFLPLQIHFITSKELHELWPKLSPKERENKICQKYGAVFIIGIGGELPDQTLHDGRAPDYDDWELNGDILIHNPLFNQSLEISSMGIRVDKQTLIKQLNIRNCSKRQFLYWHRLLLGDKLPLTIGGGIGQSRVAMLLLQKKHIGEIQVSNWPKKIQIDCQKNGISLLQ